MISFDLIKSRVLCLGMYYTLEKKSWSIYWIYKFVKAKITFGAFGNIENVSVSFWIFNVYIFRGFEIVEEMIVIRQDMGFEYKNL